MAACFYRALESISIASALTTALTIYLIEFSTFCYATSITLRVYFARVRKGCVHEATAILQGE